MDYYYPHYYYPQVTSASRKRHTKAWPQPYDPEILLKNNENFIDPIFTRSFRGERQRVTERDSESARERRARERQKQRARTRVRAREGVRERGDVAWCGIGADVVGVV